MKIAIATNDMVQVAGHPGRASHFVIVEVTADNIISGQTVVRNDLTHHHTHGPNEQHQHAQGHSGHSHARLVNALQGCKYFVAASMGPRLIADLQQNGIEPVTCGNINIEDAALQVVSGQLTLEAKPCK